MASEGRAAALDEVARLKASAAYRIGRSITRVVEHVPYADAAWRRYDELYRAGVRGAIAARLPKLKSLAQSIRRRGAALSSVYTPLLARSQKVQYTAVQAGLTPDWVTVVIPVLDAAPLLGDAVESALGQTYPRAEVVLVVTASAAAANTVAAVLARYERHPRVRIAVMQGDGDLAKALVAGFTLAQGELWTWTTADNLMEPVQLERMIAFLRSSANVDLTYADYLALDERGQPLREIHLPRSSGSAFNPAQDDSIGPCFLYRGHVGEAIGDPVIAADDFDSWMRIRSRFRFSHLGTDELLYRYRGGRGAAARLKIFDRVTNLVKYEAKRSEPSRQPFVLEPDDKSVTLARELVAPPRIVAAAGSMSARRVALLAGDAAPPAGLQDGPTVVWFSRDSIAPYRWASWLERSNVVAIAPDARTVERVLAAGGRGFSHEELGRALDVALTRLETPAPPLRELALFRGSRPPPKIALEVQAFDKGGLEQVVVDLAIVLRAGGAIPIIVATGPVGSAGRRAERAGISVVELPPHNREAAYAELIRREQIELINAHYSLTGAPIAARAELPFVQTIHNSYVWLSDAERRAYEEADPLTTAYVCVSMTAAQFSDAQLRLPADKIVVLPNGIDTAAFQPVAAPERQRLKQKHRVPADAFVFLNVAGLRDWKGQRQLILAFADVYRHAPSARLIIAGGGSDPAYRRALGEAIERHSLDEAVQLVGHTSAVEELYALADAFVLPSFFEGYSLALLEAVCSGLPCIATDCGAAREVFARTTGRLVPLPFESLTEHDLYSLQRLVDNDEPLRTRLVDAMLEVLAAPRPALVGDETRRRFDRAQTYARHRDLFDWLIAGGAPHAARRWLRARTEWAIACDAAVARKRSA
jgi:glycosyltransferase involved in cell wall biosynthesis